MKKTLQTRVASVGTAVGAVVLGSVLWVACQPGALPCNEEDWREICAEQGVSTEKTGGSSGSSGGATGSGGSTATGSGGSTGSGGNVSPPAGSGGSGGMAPTTPAGDLSAKQIAGCTAFPTVKDMDKFFAMRCGEGAACHTNTAFGKFNVTDMWKFGAETKSKLSCIGTPLIDTSDYTKGLFWRRTQQMPTCNDGKDAGPRMPSAPMMALTDSETNCLKGYLQALAK